MLVRIKIILSCLFMLIIMVPVVNAETPAPTINVYINDEQVNFDEDPLLVNGNTLVQFRPIFEKMGYSIKWDQASQQITAQRNGNSIMMTIVNSFAGANNISYLLNVAPQIRNGVSIVPLRFVAEALGSRSYLG